LQRYTLKLALGLAASKDDDGRKSEQPKMITPKQVEDLIDLAEDAAADKVAFCKWMGVESFADIPANQHQKARAALIAKKNAGAGL
jgi:hypothetical protein